MKTENVILNQIYPTKASTEALNPPTHNY